MEFKYIQKYSNSIHLDCEYKEANCVLNINNNIQKIIKS
jgi:hypothetical protein